ncbi:MAG: o-succinylbenzoate--CoA ligase [Chloroflexi bacterium]|nr:o-succinylbenzoate--CoA ligase [Chloroflexota bacterium]
MPEWLRQRARISPERLALVCDSDRWSYRELDDRVSSVASRLAAAGVKRGDIVALLAANGSGFVQIVHALPRLGATLLPLNVRLNPGELSWQLRDAGAALLVSDLENAGDLSPALPRLSLAELTEAGQDGGGRIVAGGDSNFMETVELSAVHSVIYTSGTSGQPKGAMLTYGNHLWSSINSALNIGLRSDDRWLACMPLFHVGGLSILLRSVIYGTAAFVHQSFDAEEVNRAIDEERITILSAVSTMVRRMLEARGERPYPNTLRCLLLGGGPAPDALLAESERRGLPVLQTYGLTEAASQVTTMPPGDSRPGSAGRPLFTTEVRIESADGEAVAAGEPGEIVVRGPTVTPGYLNNPDATAQALRDGWLHTGDIGHIDTDGYLYVLDRRDDLIISGGENVYPAEVEEVLRSHAAVEDAAVIGLPDEEWGGRVMAAVVLGEDATADENELTAFCRTRLAAYKTPREIRFVDELPRNAAGKLLRRTVRDEWPADGA